MIECIAANHGLFWFLTILFILSEALGQTKLVKANGVLSFIFDFLGHVARTIRRVLFGR